VEIGSSNCSTTVLSLMLPEPFSHASMTGASPGWFPRVLARPSAISFPASPMAPFPTKAAVSAD